MRNTAIRFLVVATAIIGLIAAGCGGSEGPAGAQGPAGTAGAAGTAGKDGAPGKAGADGVAGVNGTNGTNGVDGAAGAKGDKGDPGDPGTAAVDHGTVNGTLTSDLAGDIPEGVVVKTTPDVGVTATSDAAGLFTMSLPIGTYTINVQADANYAKADIAAVTVVAGGTVAVSAKLAAINPLVLTAPVFTAPVGFGKAAQFDITVAGGTAPYTYAWSVKTAPTAITLSDAAAKNPTFTTGTLKDVLAGGKVTGLETSRKGFLPVSANQLTQMSYVYNVKVTDAAGFTKTTSVTIPTATLAQGSGLVPRNQIVILNIPGNTTAQTLTKPANATAALNEADTANPWFLPDLAGDYTVAGLTVNAGDFVGSSTTCAGCHNANATVKANVEGKFKAWANSAHGNHFFKYMEYDGAGALVWKNGPDGKPIPAPTADATTFWDKPGAMTTFQFGMTGAEGSHYGKNCVGCHTTGWNLLAVNGGPDEIAWTFPTLAEMQAAFGGDAATKAPVTTLWDAVPAGVKAFAGMQCEACHGPIANHKADGSNKPVGEYDPANCAVCHDRPSNHDRVALWKQSMHAELELAEDESTAETRGTSTSCYRCHGAQGYVQYLKNKATNPDGLDRPASLSQTGFSACTPAVGNRDYNQPLDPNCACRLSTATASTDVVCVDDATCAADANGGVCVTTGLTSSGTAFKKICVKNTCTPKAITCTPAVGHRLSTEELDPACPSKSFTPISIPFTGCTTDANCTAVVAGSICVAGQCVFSSVAADPAFYTYLSGLGLNKEKVQPLSCAACHDPHTTGLRVEGDTGPLGNGYEAKGAGAGATCMVCHNTRNTARGDFVSASSIGGPHAPVQTDLFLGVNAYFMGAGGNVSAHAVIENTCVGCHVEKKPYGVTATNTNHTFEADATICLSCHEDASFETLEGQFMVNRGLLEKAFGTAIAAAFNTGTSSAPVYNYYVMAINPATAATTCATTCAFDEVCDGTEATPTCEKKVKLVNLTVAPVSAVPSGRTANLKMTLKSAVTNPFGTGTVTELTANYRNFSSSNTLKLDGLNLSSAKFSTSGIIAKANWNYWLVSSVTANPAANVVHNPQFVFDVLNATTSKLLGAAGVGL